MTNTALLQALDGKSSDRPPFWFMRQAGRYMADYRKVRAEAGGFLDLCFDVEKAVAVTMQPINRFDMDAAILFSDILTVPLGLGQKLWFEEGEGPRLDPIDRIEDLEEFSLEGFEKRLSPVFDVVSGIRKVLPAEKALIGFGGAPWTLATYMVEGRGSKAYTKVKALAYAQPDIFEKIIERLIEASIAYLSRQIQAGAEVIQLFDSWAGALDQYGQDRWSFEPMIRIAEALKAKFPEIKIIAFARQVGTNATRLAKCPHIDGLSVDHTTDLIWAAENLQPHVCLQGNLDPIAVVAGGQRMLDEAKRVLDIWGKGPMIFNLSHGFVPQTPVPHVEALAKMLKDTHLS